MQTKTRLHYLDLIKFIAVINLCALHYSWVGDIDFSPEIALIPALRRFAYGFYACTVPLFMMVNGALLLNRPMNPHRHYKSLLVLFLQYVFWRAVSILLIGLYQGVDFSSWNLTRFVNVFLLLQEFGEVKINHLWFLPMLICIYVWVPILKGAYDNCENSPYGIKPLLYFLGVLLIFCFLLEDLMLFQPAVPFFDAAYLGGLRIFMPLSSALYSSMLFFFLLGGLLHKYKAQLSAIPFWLCLAAAFIGLLLLYWEWSVNSALIGGTYDNVFSSHENLPAAVLAAAVFILCQKSEVWLTEKTKLCRLMHIVSQESLSVYYFHWIFLATIFEYLHVADGYFFNVLRSVLLCAVCTLISLFIKRLPVFKHLLH